MGQVPDNCLTAPCHPYLINDTLGLGRGRGPDLTSEKSLEPNIYPTESIIIFATHKTIYAG
jgi:hypothetical protein